MALTKVKLIADGVIDVDHLAANHGITTDNIGEGSALYYTDARVSSYLTTNSYATEGFVTTAVSNLVDAAPSTLDTLNELAAALGDDPNFATTVTNSIATKLPLAGGTLTGSLTVQGNITSSTNEGKLILNSTAANGKQYEFISIDTGNLGLYDGTAYRLWVNGNGNIGIRSVSPGSEISSNATVLQIDDSNVASLALNHSSSGKYEVAATGLGLDIRRNGSNYITVDTSGNVGIGTTSLSAKLHIGDGTTSVFQRFNSTNGGAINFQKSGTNSAFIGEVQQGLGSGDGLLLYTYSGGDRPIRFYPGGSEKVRFAQNGDVGIGTDSPSERLHVFGGKLKLQTAANGHGWIYAEDVNHSIILRGTRSGASTNITSYHQYGDDYSNGGGHKFFTGGLLANQLERFTISNDYTIFLNNNIGVNSTSPRGTFDIIGQGANTSSNNVSVPSGTLVLGYGGGWNENNHGASIVFTQRWYSPSSGQIAMAQITGVKERGDGNFGGGLAFWTSNQNESNLLERVRINEYGNVGIGTTSPGEKLDVVGKAKADAFEARSLGDITAGTPYTAALPYGISSMTISSPCDNNWRTLLYNVDYHKVFMWVRLGDALSRDMAHYAFQATFPNYGVAAFSVLDYFDGGWNTGGFEFTLGVIDGRYAILVRASSYYSSSNTASGSIYFLRLE
jgi:hypothetical protein